MPEKKMHTYRQLLGHCQIKIKLDLSENCFWFLVAFISVISITMLHQKLFHYWGYFDSGSFHSLTAYSIQLQFWNNILCLFNGGH